MSHYSETLASWNAAARRYEERFMELPLYNDTYDALCDRLPPGAALLEIGCGPGNITRYLVQQRPDLRITATDAAPAMLALARAHCPAAAVLQLDARELSGMPPGCWDALVCGFILPYLKAEDAAGLLSETARLLRPGGLLYLSFVPGDPAASGFQTGSSGDRMYFHYYQEDWVAAKITAAGLREEVAFEKTYGQDRHRLLLASKSR